jgi:hypothetical protein
MATTHYHVTTHPDDDDQYTTNNLFDALDYAAVELDHLADFEHEGMSITASAVEQGYNGLRIENSVSKDEMEEALLSFVKMERFDNLRRNAANMVKQHKSKRGDRAPIYRPSWQDQGTEKADAVLSQSARNVAQEINVGSPLMIWECPLEDDNEDE